MSNYEDEMLRYKVESAEKWRASIPDIPKLTIPDGFQIRVIPPFGGALARFQIFKGEKSVSVYFDTMSRLGACNGPCWEAYPIGDTNERWAPDEHEQMMAAIVKELTETKE